MRRAFGLHPFGHGARLLSPLCTPSGRGRDAAHPVRCRTGTGNAPPAAHCSVCQPSTSTPCATSERFYPPDREVLKGINLSFYPGAKIGVIGGNGSGKSSLLRIMAGEDDGFTGEARLTAGFTVGHLSQEPQLDPDKDVLGNVSDGVAETKALVDRFNEVCAAMGEPDADFDKLLERAGRAPGQDRRRRRLGPRADLRHRHGRAPAPARATPTSPRCPVASGAGRPVPAPAVQARSPAPRRAHQPPRRRVGGLVGADPPGVPGHRGGRDPRPLLPRQRGRLDPRARPGRGHPLGGQLLLVAGAEAGPPGRRAEGRQVPPGGPPARARVDPHVAPGPAEQGQGPHQRLQRPGGRGRGRRPSGRQAGDHHPARTPARRPGGRRRGAGQGVRRPAADRRAVVPAAPGWDRGGDRTRTAPARPPCSG